MKTLSAILASMILFAGISFAGPVKHVAKQEKAKTEKKETKKTEKKEAKKAEKKADKKADKK